MSKKNRLLFFCLAAIACSGMLPARLAAQCPPKTTISDTLYNADGSSASGRIVIAWPTFLVGACQVIAGQTTVSVAGGMLTVQLYPNSAAVPAGTSYRVTYALKSGRITTEYWVVPASTAPVSLVTVRAPTAPIPNVMFGEAQVTNLVSDLARKVELPSPCPTGKLLQSNGSSSPPQVNCVDPSSGSGSQHQANGLNLIANDPINFQDTSTIAITNPAAGNVQAAVKDASITAAKLSVANPSAGQLFGVSDANITAGALSPNRVAGIAVVQSRSIGTSAPLSGGGALSADHTISCPTCEANTNKGVASGYASLNASALVIEDPASAQTTPAASKIPLADATGKIADGWLSSNVSFLGSSIDLASEVSGQLSAANGGTGANNAALAGRYLRGDGANFVTSAFAAAGAGACTNQFVRSNNDNAGPTCASVAGSDFVNQNTNQIFAGPSSGGAAAPSFRAMVKTDTPGTTVHTDQANTWTTGAQDMGAATSLVVPKAAGAAPTADGDARYDTTRKAFAVGGNGAVTGFIPRVLKMTNCTTEGNCASASGGNQVDAAAGAQGTAETNFASNWTMPASFLFANKAIQVCAVFEYTTTASPPTLIIRLKAGTTVLVANPAVAALTNQTNKGAGYCFVVQGTAAAGASVNVEAGYIMNNFGVGSNQLNSVDQPVLLGTSAAQTIQLSAQWGTATTGNTIRMQQFYVMELN